MRWAWVLALALTSCYQSRFICYEGVAYLRVTSIPSGSTTITNLWQRNGQPLQCDSAYDEPEGRARR